MLLPALLCFAWTAYAQNLLPVHPHDSPGSNAPAGWRLAEGKGIWTAATDRSGQVFQVDGAGEDSAYWRMDLPALKPGGVYRFQFEGKRLADAAGGGAIAGLNRVNRDFPLSSSWQSCGFVFRTPDNLDDLYLRLGQWHIKGSVVFAQPEWVPVLVAQRQENGLELGEGETIDQGIYRFNANFGWEGANYHRTLHASRANFNSDRWVFGPGQAVIYRFKVGEYAQKSAQLRVAINYYDGGDLKVEAGKDLTHWLDVAAYGATNRGGLTALPSALFPAAEIYIRLRHAGETGAFQVNTLDYQAPLAGDPPSLRGATRFMDSLAGDARLAVQLRRLELSPDRQSWRIQLALQAGSPGLETVRAVVGREPAETNKASSLALVNPVAKSIDMKPAGLGAKPVLAELEYPIGKPGADTLWVRLNTTKGDVLFTGRSSVLTGFLDDNAPGYWLAESPQMGLWWCESGWKIGRERGLPPRPVSGKASPISVSLAQGEFEPMQLILRPAQAGQLLSAKWLPAKNAVDARRAIQVAFDEVAYVQVTQPTDRACQPGWYPDPLPPLRLPLNLAPDRNQPLWITFHAPTNCPPGGVAGRLEIKTTAGDWSVPVRLTVYGFALPRETHLQSALGLNAGIINEYHGLTRREDQEAVYEKYLRNFASHRISPYSFYDYAPLNVRFEGEGDKRQARLDFTQFDKAAARWLDDYQFSTFQLRLLGMGGGTFQSRSLGQLEGFQEGTPEHTRLFQDYLGQVERHLRERGWLDKAFTYWFDEPDPKDYEFVVAGMKRLRAAAPKLARMLTEQPEPALIGNVDIWCGLTPEWTRERVAERRAAGERVWWYICCAPTAPYATEFIDHPGTELRLWPWQSWQYGVTGILVWETTYWNSPLVTLAPNHQDPWADPMSYVSGYDFPVGHVGYWGNGDGRFLYPPNKGKLQPSTPNFDGPVNSLRWENLRDGMEDYEYLWLLQREITRLENHPGAKSKIKAAKALLVIPETVSRDLTHFTTDPRPLLKHRDQVARMIERLVKIKE